MLPYGVTKCFFKWGVNARKKSGKGKGIPAKKGQYMDLNELIQPGSPSECPSATCRYLSMVVPSTSEAVLVALIRLCVGWLRLCQMSWHRAPNGYYFAAEVEW